MPRAKAKKKKEHGGRKRRRHQGRGRHRKTAPKNYWHLPSPDLPFGDEEFRLSVRRGEQASDVREVFVDDFMTNLSWDDTSPILKGTMTMVNPTDDKPLAISEGHVVTCDVSRKGRGLWTELWRMRIEGSSLSGQERTTQFQLADELAWLQRSRDDFKFKNKRAHQIARAICKKYRMPVGRLAKGKHKIKNLTKKNASPLEVLLQAYANDRKETGRRYVVRMRLGKLEVVPLRRSRDLLEIGPALLDAQLTNALREDFATATTARASKPRGGGKVRAKVVSKEGVRRYGYVYVPMKLDDHVGSRAAAKRRALRKLAKSQKPKQELTLTHPGIASLRRGDAIQLRLPSMGLSQLVYVSGVVHTVSAGEFTSEVTCTFDDPYVDTKEDKARKKRRDKARKHKRKQPRDHGGRRHSPPKPKRAKNRR